MLLLLDWTGPLVGREGWMVHTLRIELYKLNLTAFYITICLKKGEIGKAKKKTRTSERIRRVGPIGKEKVISAC